MKLMQRHAVVENWDNDLADEDDDDIGLADTDTVIHTDIDRGLQGNIAGPSSSLILPPALGSDVRRKSTSRLGLVSPHSMGSFRLARVDGG